MSSNNLSELRNSILKESKIIKEINSFLYEVKGQGSEEKKMIISHINILKNNLKKEGIKVLENLESLSVTQPMPKNAMKIDKEEDEEMQVIKPMTTEESKEGRKEIRKKTKKGFFESGKIKLDGIEKHTLKRLREREERNIPKWLIKQKEMAEEVRTQSDYVIISNKLFGNLASPLAKKDFFKSISGDLVKSNMRFTTRSYVSVILFTTFLSFLFALVISAFFLFFWVAVLPYTWVLLFIPLIVFFFMFFYPSTERSTVEKKINQELPFATINMAAISGSMIDPSKVFNIIFFTREYPNLEKEFLKVINGVYVMGYDLVTVLRSNAFNSPSKKLSDLFNGLATTISSGGDLPKFFDETAKSMMFEYELEKEKGTKAAETFMDLYISVVIAAPMMLMLLLIIMQVSGLGLTLSTNTITLLVVVGVTFINLIFLSFLHIKQQNE